MRNRSIGVGALLLFIAPIAVRASCVARSAEELYRTADLILAGTVSTIGPSPAGGDDIAVTAQQVFKGTRTPEIIIHDTDGPVTTSVDVGFVEGKTFLLFLRSENGGNRYLTTVCDGSRAWSGELTDEEQRAFGATQTSGTFQTAKRSTAALRGLFLAMIVIAAIAGFLALRMQRTAPARKPTVLPAPPLKRPEKQKRSRRRTHTPRRRRTSRYNER